MPVFETIGGILEAFVACAITIAVPYLTLMVVFTIVVELDQRLRRRFGGAEVNPLNHPGLFVLPTPIGLGIVVSVWIALPPFISTAHPLGPFGTLQTWSTLVGVPATWSVAILAVTDRLTGPSLYTSLLRSISIKRPHTIDNPPNGEATARKNPRTMRGASTDQFAFMLCYSPVVLVPIALIYGIGMWWVIGGLFVGGWLLRQIVTLGLRREYRRQRRAE